MIPTYNPLDFENLDLRKYHIKSLKDLRRFIAFVSARLEEADHIVKKIANENSTLKSVVNQMQHQQEKINALYGAPTGSTPASSEATREEAKIESVEDKAVQQERDELLDEMRQAVSNESLVTDDNQVEEDKLSAAIDQYKLTVGNFHGKERLYWYKDKENSHGAFSKQMCKETDVPEEIRHQLLHAIGRE